MDYRGNSGPFDFSDFETALIRMDLRGKRVTVVGLGRSGLAASNLLIEKGARVSITECLDSQKIKENIRKLKGTVPDIEIGRHTEDLIKGRDLVVISPGVSGQTLPVLWAKKKGIPVVGEIELAFASCPAPIIAISGTNGKTTVSTLVGRIFRKARRRCVVCGNIGNPFSGEVLGISNEDVVILEVSSFQLETIDKFKPKVAVILNLSTDHLDRYADFNEYFRVKCRIFSNQTEVDWAILNKEDAYGLTMAKRTKARVLFFSKNKAAAPPGFDDNQIAALTISSLFALPKDVAIDTCRHFKGIEHRMEQVAEFKGVEFINDSKATNVDSTLWALNSIKKPIILIAGGKDKGSNFTALRERINDSVRAMILLGEAKEKIEETFRDVVKTLAVTSLSEAVRCALRLARPGDCVLLSPMCASFDMFSDYTERGRVFKQAVYDLVHSVHQC